MSKELSIFFKLFNNRTLKEIERLYKYLEDFLNKDVSGIVSSYIKGVKIHMLSPYIICIEFCYNKYNSVETEKKKICYTKSLRMDYVYYW